jgi:hypothetical protein
VLGNVSTAMIVMDNRCQELIGELHKRMGRNLMLFQGIEYGLKMILPFVHPDGAKKDGIVSFEKYRANIKSKTLGVAINDLFASMEIGTDTGNPEWPEAFKSQIRKILDCRNEFVHGGFFERPGLSTTSKEGIENTIRYLDEQCREAEGLWRFVAEQVLACLAAQRISNPNQSPQFEQLYKFTRAYVSSYAEWINLIDPSDTNWPNTKIVKLLQFAEMRIEPVDVWIMQPESEAPKPGKATMLSRAEKFIRSQDGEITPKLYGLKNWKEVLDVSGVFNVWESRGPNSPSGVMFYRSKDSLGGEGGIAEPFVDRIIFGG